MTLLKSKFFYTVALSVVLPVALAGCRDSVTPPEPEKKTELTGIIVTPESVGLVVGNSRQLNASPDPADADPAEQPFIYSAINPAIADVSEDGLITGKAVGSTTVSVAGRISTQIIQLVPVKVTAAAVPLTAISVAPESLTMNIGEEQKLKATPVPEDASDVELSWTSSDANIASVNYTGKVTAKKAGEAVITVKSGAVKTDIPVTVLAAPLTGIQLSHSSLNLYPYDEQTITATPVPADAAGVTFTWSSDNEAVATVSATGHVVAIKNGLAIITVKCGSVERTIPVTVAQPKFSIKINSGRYFGDTIASHVFTSGIRWYQIKLPEFISSVTPNYGKGLVFTVTEVDLTKAEHRLEVVPAPPSVSRVNSATPLQMYNSAVTYLAKIGRRPVAVTNADFFQMNATTIGYGKLNNRPDGMEVVNGKIAHAPWGGSACGLLIKDDKSMNAVNYFTWSGSVSAGGVTVPLCQDVNGVNNEDNKGVVMLYNNLAHAYSSSDSAFAWAPYTADFVRLSQPAGGWKTNAPMEFTVTAKSNDVPAATGARFNGDGAILVGCGLNNQPLQTLGMSNSYNVTVADKTSYWELTATAATTSIPDPTCYVNTTKLTGNVKRAATASLTFDYQSASEINDLKILYGNPEVETGKSFDNLHLDNTGLDAGNEAKWKSITIDLKSIISEWGDEGKGMFRFYLKASQHILLRNMKVSATFSAATDAKSFFAALNVGDKVTVQTNIFADGAATTDAHLNVVGCDTRGYGIILRNGTVYETWAETHPRTVLGWTSDSKKAWLVLIDGRQTGYSCGSSTGQAGVILQALGADIGMNFDGGGSSAMVIDGAVRNSPSETRRVANGLMFSTKQ
ncbi:MAG: Ig-like domain-containing protein [Bacteroidales bacterium]|jgi:uncharacterized protein YjdB|nr:Ig-like domain-containing protein [Bacteroidales bacterium]